MVAGMFKLKALVILGMLAIAQVPSVAAAPATITVDWSIPPSIGALPPKRSVTGDTLKVCKGDTVVFGWGGFHGVATTSAGKYKTCSLSGYKEVAKVSGGGSYTVKPSGTKYYICQVAGHCSSGQKLKIVTGPAC